MSIALIIYKGIIKVAKSIAIFSARNSKVFILALGHIILKGLCTGFLLIEINFGATLT